MRKESDNNDIPLRSDLLNNRSQRIFDELSEQEDQVAQMIGSGLEAKEVAEARYKSVATIRNQMQSIYEKLGVRNRSELSIKMMERIYHISLTNNNRNQSNSGQNFGSIEGNNQSSYSNVGNTISLSLPEFGTQKIINPDGEIIIQNIDSNIVDPAERKTLNQRIKDLERIIIEKDATIKSKDEMISFIKDMLNKQQ